MKMTLRNIIGFLFFGFFGTLLKLRYRVQADPAKALSGHSRKKILVLPNHPGYVDPPLVMSQVWPLLQPRPLSWSGNWNNPFMIPFLWVVNAIPIPDLSKPSQDAREKMALAMNEIVEGLKAGQNQILWPSGRLQREGIERLSGTSGVWNILCEYPETDLLLCRTEGVWGSRFSFGFNGERPDFSRQGLISLGWLVASLFFFMPKRPVKMTFQLVKAEEWAGKDRTQVNKFIEDFLNNGNPAPPPVLIPYHPFLPSLPTAPATIGNKQEFDVKGFKNETTNAINVLIEQKLKQTLTPTDFRPEKAMADFGLDSLDVADITLLVEQTYGFHADEIPQTLGGLWALAHGAAPKSPPKPAPKGWSKKPGALTIPSVNGSHLAEALFQSCLRNRSRPAVADDVSGMLTFDRLFLGAFALAQQIKKLPGKNIGVLLPASVGNDVVLFACFLAGKVPVLLNWTVGPATLKHCAQIAGIKQFLTSKRFMDRIHLEVEGTKPIYLENLRAEISKSTLLWLALCWKIHPRGFKNKLPSMGPDETAVVLFTSGSEKAPKAVPLTHTNLLSNQKAGIEFLEFKENDVFLGFLPAFHSFGLNVTSLFPMVLGIRVVHHPDPTDGAGLASKIRNYGVTVVLGTPTFVGMILDRSQKGDWESVRLTVCGAEKLTEPIANRFSQTCSKGTIIEGYGITECGPVVAANPPTRPKRGSLGLPLPGTKFLIVDPEDGTRIPEGSRGMLLVRSPSVFPGYWGTEEDPFVEIDGEKWYRTGDLCRVDEEGFLHFEGRLKRFIKAGGEMVSLPALEEVFSKRYPPDEKGPRMAVEGIDDHGKRLIVLFSNCPITLTEANSLLQADGFRGVFRLDQVHFLETIPVLGTGKTNYRELRTHCLKLLESTS